MGKCSYYLMKDLNYTIEAENVPCAGAISEVSQPLTYLKMGLVVTRNG